jgi:hypothetical protein
MHSTDDLNDGYLGSGKYLKRSVNKYGAENFKIEFLEFFDERKDLKEREKNFVNEEFLKDPLCMNLKIGGEGGWGPVNIEACRKGAIARTTKQWKDPEFIKNHKKRYSDLYKKLWKEGKLKHYDQTGSHHTQDAKDKIGEANSKYQMGKGNSQFGSCWIHNTIESKKIKKEDLISFLSNGWNKGRKMFDKNWNSWKKLKK